MVRSKLNTFEHVGGGGARGSLYGEEARWQRPLLEPGLKILGELGDSQKGDLQISDSY